MINDMLRIKVLILPVMAILLWCSPNKEQSVSSSYHRTDPPNAVKESTSPQEIAEMTIQTNPLEIIPSWTKTIVYVQPESYKALGMSHGNHEMQMIAAILKVFHLSFFTEIHELYCFSPKLLPLEQILKDMIVFMVGDATQARQRMVEWAKNPHQTDLPDEWGKPGIMLKTPIFTLSHDDLTLAFPSNGMIVLTSTHRMREALSLLYGLNASYPDDTTQFFAPLIKKVSEYGTFRILCDVRNTAKSLNQKSGILDEQLAQQLPKQEPLPEGDPSCEPIKSYSAVESIFQRKKWLDTLGSVESIAVGTRYKTIMSIGLFFSFTTNERSQSFGDEIQRVKESPWIASSKELRAWIPSIQSTVSQNECHITAQINTKDLQIALLGK